VPKEIEVVERTEAVERFPQPDLWMVRQHVIVEEAQHRSGDPEPSRELNLLQVCVAGDPLRIFAIELAVNVQNTRSRQHPRSCMVGDGVP
jgi:hypothetical protein